MVRTVAGRDLAPLRNTVTRTTPTLAGRESTTRRIRRIGLIVNAVIMLAIALVIAMTWRVVTSDAEPASADRQTATVDTGDVTATVSASGRARGAGYPRNFRWCPEGRTPMPLSARH